MEKTVNKYLIGNLFVCPDLSKYESLIVNDEMFGSIIVDALMLKPSSIGVGGTEPLFYMMEQFVSMGVPAHFSI